MPNEELRVPWVIRQTSVAANSPHLGGRIDRLVQELAGGTRAHVAGLFDFDCVTVNAQPTREPWRRLVAADPHGELRRTLRAWLDQDMSPQRCAAALHVHRNTLRSRLHRIEQVTGLELGRVPSLLQLYLGPLLVSEPTT